MYIRDGGVSNRSAQPFVLVVQISLGVALPPVSSSSLSGLSLGSGETLAECRRLKQAAELPVTIRKRAGSKRRWDKFVH